MKRDDILAIVQDIYFGPADNDIITSLLEKICNITPNSNISDLIFHNSEELTPEQVVEEAMRRESKYISMTAKE